MPASVSEEYRWAIGRAIAEARSERGMTQDQLRRAIGNSKNAVSNWERGVSAPTAESIRSLCHALGVTPQRLLVMNGAGADGRGPGWAAAARGLADELVEMRAAAENAVPDLMEALVNAERKARELADGEV